MQKYKFDITCPDALFKEIAQSPPEYKNSVLSFHAPDATECTM
jgi:hypothetical protein